MENIIFLFLVDVSESDFSEELVLFDGLEVSLSDVESFGEELALVE